MLLPSPLLKYVNDNDVRALIEAQWMEHWMEDQVLGVGHDKDRDGLGLLQQQLHCAQMEAQLLEIALNQSKSSRHYISPSILQVDDGFGTPTGCSVYTTSASPGDDLSKPLDSLDINEGKVPT